MEKLNGLLAYQFHLFQKFSSEVEHAVFSRVGGVSEKPYDSLNVRFGIGDKVENVKKNRELICKAFGINGDAMVSTNQTHCKNVKIIDADFLKANKAGDEVDGVDALITSLSGVALMVQVADCQAILMFDPVKKVAAAVHAGWKGLVQDIIGETIGVMESRFDCAPEDILVGIAPSLGPCCAFFSNPKIELPKNFQEFIDDEERVDLWSFSLQQLHSHGIASGHIELARICTQCGKTGSLPKAGVPKAGSRAFFSFRGEHGITGRFGVAIKLN